MSADDLRINLWNLNISDQSFSAYLAFACLEAPVLQRSYASLGTGITKYTY